jgi:hypothetical protein
VGGKAEKRVVLPFPLTEFKGWKIGAKIKIFIEKNDFMHSTNYKLLTQNKRKFSKCVFKFIISVMGGHSHIVKTTTPSAISRPVIFTDSLRIYF